MKVKACIYTDAGKRKVNQDAALVKVASSKKLGRISFVAVCDGMGGLSRGEVASCKVIRALETWFHEEMILMQDLEGEELWDTIEKSLLRLLARANAEIRRYGRHRRISLGTTVTALLQIGREYIALNVGDSRIYFARNGKAYQITKDQSVVQDKIDKGLITIQEAGNDPQKSVLLQCVGTTSVPKPQVIRGELKGNTTVVACTDGIWRTIESQELYDNLCPQMCVSSEDMLDSCKKLAEAAFGRQEKDNVSLAALCMEF